MKLLYTNEARELIAKKVKWVKGKLYNYTTFQRLVDEGLLPAVKEANRGPDAFDENDVLALIEKFPPVEPPRKPGIVRWLKGDRPKNSKKVRK